MMLMEQITVILSLPRFSVLGRVRGRKYELPPKQIVLIVLAKIVLDQSANERQ